MGLSPVLFIKSNEDISINIRVRLVDDFSEHEVILNSIFIQYKSNNQSIPLKFLELLESVIKRTINEVLPHKTLKLVYSVKSEGFLATASKIEVKIIEVSADDINFKLDVQPIVLDNLNEKIEGAETVYNTYEKNIDTPDFVLKKYKQMKN